MTVVTPQLLSPFQLDATGKPMQVEQDSPADVESCVFNVLVCPMGGKLGDPSFGVPQLLFSGVPLNTQATLDAIRRLEPRATLAIIDKAAGTDPSTRNITVNVGVA